MTEETTISRERLKALEAVAEAADEYYDFITIENNATGMRSYKMEVALEELKALS